MAYISFQPTDYFNTVLYTGTGAELPITGVGFQPDWVWMKSRSGASNSALYDSVRGVEKGLASNLSSGENTSDTGLEVFGSDGFTLGTNGNSNTNTVTYASWNWKAGTTTGLSGGTITPTAYSINTTSGFGIYQYTGNEVSGATIAHGLGVTPQMIIVKRTQTTGDWMVYTEAVGNTKYLTLNGTASATASASTWNNTSPTSTVFTLGDGSYGNADASTYIAYVFAPKKGYSAFGGYTGNGNADGPFVYTGFRPAFLILRRTDSGGDWFCWDDKRGPYNVNTPVLVPNATTAETSQAIPDFVANGFKLRNTNVDANASGGTYIYMAFAEFPLVSSNSKAGTAR